MAIVVKTEKIVMTLVKNLTRGCRYPCSMLFTVIKDKGEVNDKYILTTDKSVLLKEFLDSYNKWFLLSKDSIEYEYNRKGLIESITRYNAKVEKARKIWKQAVKLGWSVIKDES